MPSGRFITFEGGEGSGKSTQAQLLAQTLRTRGVDPILTREPGGSPFAEHVRNLILDPATPPHSPLSE
ncbi:dTMP kinase, partial [Salmonella sp. SAL4431]|uniref:dTMP kinase n=1 Tax=Salmonella sp. SAL4431 TaxID=3159886 RepID=UPI00397A27D6